MSGQHGQGTPARIQKTSPIAGKQGPLKATIPMSSVFKPNSSLKGNGNSPTISPNSNWKSTRISPDHSSGQRSPGSSAYKGKSKSCGRENSNVMRRTASLDTIYLKGHWPRDSYYCHTGILQINKSTQTDEDESDQRKIHSISESEDKLGKIMLRKIRGGSKETNGRHGLSPGDQTLDTSSQTVPASCLLYSPTFKAVSVNIPMKPLPKSSIRSSVEGLNQEIERIVLKTDSGESHSCDRGDRFSQVTPEGHRAPLAEMLRCPRSRSVNTQTPNAGDFPGSCHSSADSQGSSPDQESSKLGTSPHINKFLAREPPDGCEKVFLKSVDDQKCVRLEHVPQPCTFKLKPSLGSAFQILQPTLNAAEQDIPIVPPEQDLN